MAAGRLTLLAFLAFGGGGGGAFNATWRASNELTRILELLTVDTHRHKLAYLGAAA